MKITPVPGHYVIELPEVHSTGSGLIVADVAQNYAPVIGTVVVSPRKSWFGSTPFPPGTQLVFRKYAIDELTLQTSEGQKKLWLLDAREILGVVS